MKAHFFIFFLLIGVSSLSFAQIGAKSQQNKIYGIWRNIAFGYQMTLILKADGTGEFDGDAITFTSQSNQLVIKQDGVSNTYTFTLQGNSLTVSGGDLDQAIIFTRSGESQPATAEKKTAPPAGPIPPKLIGSWSNYGETIEFKADGQCTYLGQTYPYSVSGNYVTLQTNQGDVMMGFAVTGTQLEIIVNGQSFTYNKTQAPPTTNTQTKTPGNSKHDMSLVGKWCYINVTSTGSGGTSTDACITINGDGTYSYYSERSMSASNGGTASQSSDSGTWWIEGDRIFYNSQTQGQGSYQLVKQNHPKTGDPMIVLDGTSYVTYFQKVPW